MKISGPEPEPEPRFDKNFGAEENSECEQAPDTRAALECRDKYVHKINKELTAQRFREEQIKRLHALAKIHDKIEDIPKQTVKLHKKPISVVKMKKARTRKSLRGKMMPQPM